MIMFKCKKFAKKATAVALSAVMCLSSFVGTGLYNLIPAKAATTVKSVAVPSLDEGTTKDYAPFELPADSSGVSITTSGNLKKASDSDWIWKPSEQGAEHALKKLGNAYIASLTTDGSYWIQYNNVAFDKKTGTRGYYDVRAVFDNATGSISTAYGKDIAVFDGQLGAVRFRGFKHLDYTIYAYEHGAKSLFPKLEITGTIIQFHLKIEFLYFIIMYIYYQM